MLKVTRQQAENGGELGLLQHKLRCTNTVKEFTVWANGKAVSSSLLTIVIEDKR